MIKEPKHIDFITTGRQPTDEEFKLITKWIKSRKLPGKKLPRRQTVKRSTTIAD